MGIIHRLILTCLMMMLVKEGRRRKVRNITDGLKCESFHTVSYFSSIMQLNFIWIFLSVDDTKEDEDGDGNDQQPQAPRYPWDGTDRDYLYEEVSCFTCMA